MQKAVPVAAFFLALAFAGPAPAASKLFNAPAQRNIPIDKCLGPGGPCGQATANAFCKAKGFKLSNGFALSGNAATVYLGSSAKCGRRDCGGFATIACTDTPQFGATSSTDIGEVKN